MVEKKKFENSLRIMRFCLLLSGIKTYSTPWNSTIDVFVNSCLFYRGTNLLTLYTVSLGEIIWLIQGIHIGLSFVKLSLVLPLITITFLSTLKAFYLYLNRNIVCEIIATLKAMHPEEKPNNTHFGKEDERFDEKSGSNNKENEDQITNESVTILNTVVNLLMVIMASVLVMFCLAPLMAMGFEYFSEGETGILYPFDVEYWFDVHDTKLWPVVYLHQVAATIIVCVNILGSELLIYVICAYIEMHFRILCHQFQNLQLISQRQIKEDLVKGVLKHQQLIYLIDQAEKLFTKSALFHIVSSSLLICLSAFNITVAEDMKTVFMFLSFLLLSLSQVSLLCFFGDKLMESSTQVSGAVYKCPWYDFDEKTKKAVLIIIMRARKPCKLTAANFAELNLRAFTTILSHSWSYFALLKTVYK